MLERDAAPGELRRVVRLVEVELSPLETVGGEDVRDLGRSHLQTPPLSGGTARPRLSPLEERRAQPGPPLLAGAWGHPQLPQPPGPQLHPLQGGVGRVEEVLTGLFPVVTDLVLGVPEVTQLVVI